MLYIVIIVTEAFHENSYREKLYHDIKTTNYLVRSDLIFAKNDDISLATCGDV